MIEKQHPYDALPDLKATCYQCGKVTGQLYNRVHNTVHCDACHAQQCERVRCKFCGKTITTAEGQHYCNNDRYEESAWIKVSDRVPDANDEYNVFLSGQVTTLWFSTEKKKWIQSDRFSDIEFDDEVTHWQTLPPPPEAV